MCGITGIWRRKVGPADLQGELEESVASMRHRGPDDNGIWQNASGLGFGFTRLSILDLSELGHQPMISPDGRYVLVFNGEVYNFAEIRRDLVGLGHNFAGSGDTEVILHALAEWGSQAVERFVGMFAFAIWDEREQRLELVRDRAGVKPLHYGWDGETLCFGSELKALRAYRHWRPEVDRQALGEFLQYGYVAGDRTIYRGIRKLEPGHRLVLEAGGEPRLERYWSVDDAVRDAATGSDADLEAELEALLIESCRLRMVSDVPVGVFLSGGVDSSLVTALLAKHHDREIRTFTIGFGADSHDESQWAKKVADHCGTRHTEYILSSDEGLSIAKDWGSLFDEPFGDPSGIPTLLVSRLAREQVKVVLSADGGDELFSGYRVYDSVLERMQSLSRVPRWLGTAAAGATSSLLPALSGRISERRHRQLRHFGQMMASPTPGRVMDIRLSHWQPADVDRLIDGYRPLRPLADDYPGRADQQMSLWDIHHYLPEDILTKVDRTTMAVSMEGREPLLDHRLMEFALALPLHLRRGELGPKHLLKRILHRHVARELVDRPKQGFGIPLDDWLKRDLRPLVQEYLAADRIRNAGLFDPATVRETVEAFYHGRATQSTPLWFLLAFEMWREQWG